MGLFKRHKPSPSQPSQTAPSTSTSTPPNLTKSQLKLATRTRKIFEIITSLLLLLAVIFLILVNLGSISKKPVLRNWYFIKLDLSHIVPNSVPNAVLINTIAQTLGLHDFYQVGLWGFCEGYVGRGVSFCSKPETLYWFNPVEILTNELLAGASISLPSDINDILDLIKFVSQIMFAFFLTSACLSFLLIFLVPISIYTRWLSLLTSIFTFINALLCTAASVIATVMFIIFKNVIGSVGELNIQAEIGKTLFVFMWIASACTLLAFGIQMGMCCCCASRRDVKTGRRRGRESAYEMEERGTPAHGNGVAPNAHAGQEKYANAPGRF